MKPRKTTTTKIAFLEKITNYELQNLILGQSIASSWVFLGLLYSLLTLQEVIGFTTKTLRKVDQIKISEITIPSPPRPHLKKTTNLSRTTIFRE